MVKRAPPSHASGAVANAAGVSTPDGEAPSKAPDEIVEERVLRRMQQEGLIDAKGVKAIKTKLASGDLKPEDWKLALENALEREAQRK